MLTTAALTITLIVAPCPGHPEYSGCYEPATNTMYLKSLDAGTVAHEIGHAVDDQLISPADREWFARSTRSMASVSPPERFADLYRTCTLRGLLAGLRGRVWTGDYGATYPAPLYRRMCRQLRYYTRGLSYANH